MQTSVSASRRNRQEGQAIIFVVLAVGIVIAGAMGLAIDTAQIYGQRQMAQSVADSAAEAGILSIFSGTNTGNTDSTQDFATTVNPAAYDCASTFATSPCKYANLNGAATSDTVTVSFPTAVSGVSLTPNSYNAKAIQVLVTRTVNSTFMKMITSNTTTVKAKATAAIVQGNQGIPIVVLHPNLAGAFNINGTASVAIVGGPQLSFQVNSKAAGAVSESGTMDLSKAGPSSSGGDFGTFGTATGSWTFLPGSTGHFYRPNPPTQDPFKSIAAPSNPTASHPGSSSTVAAGTGDCPGPVGGPDCTKYTPGFWAGTSPATRLDQINNTAIFEPGLYWVNSRGFSNSGPATIIMCGTNGGTCDPIPAWDTSGCCTQAGKSMLMYLGGGNINLGSQASMTLKGSDTTSSFKGILFFVNHSAGAQTHKLGGGGALSQTGSLYATNCTATPCVISGSTYQSVELTGHSGNDTNIYGQIITDQLVLKGTSGVTMTLDSTILVPIDKVALVK
jgi:hypothetical protein